MNAKHLTSDELIKMANFDYQKIDEIGKAWSDILRDHLADAPGRTVLDAGCGAGFLSILLAKMGWRVVGVDFSASILEQARINAQRYQVSDRITFCQCDTSHTNLEAGIFDAVVSRHASSQFRNPYSAYEEWFRLLKAGGIVVNFDANWLSPLWDEELARTFFEDEKKVKEECADYKDIYHDRYAMYHLSQYPLSYQKRPDWDEAVCKEIGFQKIESRFLPDTGLRTPIQSQRFRVIPTFVIKALK